jgi:D-glycero-D-manno-heptose 1,7-bisphosphate phosphatase
MPQTLTLLYGLPGAGKSTYAHPPKETDTVVISRDVIGGTVKQLVPRVRRLLEEGKSVVLDNTHLTAESRAPFIELGQSLEIPVHCTVIETPMETCQINVLRRMWATHGQFFHTGKRGDAQAYAPVTLYAGRKKAEPPTIMEGFVSIETVPTVVPAWPKERYAKKALFLDIDGTLRASEHLPHKYPTDPAEVTLLYDPKRMRAVLQCFKADGYILVGLSNQSGIAKGTLTAAKAEACFAQTRALLGYSEEEFPILYCPHAAAPPSCYCRKPQAGMLVEACERYGINPVASLMVGDMKTDETAAGRMGIPFKYADKFWSQEFKTRKF